ncbi:hypothetical protein AZF37_09720 (plasmid) [endosymbiont 'TC1' of Trimyema compressum]|uniref:hypothetical protein n=1 Tax=endosymbiont 'TC1' of Trimyema compressum TaxID=243899 RepID=UPI0007F0B8BB|nr:hypothetical protein [endosymbiont 'TC1' of Trimyema compressum]AMP21451.1 hypothetical protein AZF37_09720 [endosymbiont 'TC1' of Trimyema compressum]
MDLYGKQLTELIDKITTIEDTQKQLTTVFVKISAITTKQENIIEDILEIKNKLEKPKNYFIIFIAIASSLGAMILTEIFKLIF